MLNFKQFLVRESEDLEENILTGLFKLGKKGSKVLSKKASTKPKGDDIRSRISDAMEKSNYKDWAEREAGHSASTSGLSATKARKVAEKKAKAERDLNVAKKKSPSEEPLPLRKEKTPTSPKAPAETSLGDIARDIGKVGLSLTAFAPDEMASGELKPEYKQLNALSNLRPSNTKVGKGHPGEQTIYTHADTGSPVKKDPSVTYKTDDAKASRKTMAPKSPKKVDPQMEKLNKMMGSLSKSDDPLAFDIDPKVKKRMDAARQRMLKKK